MLSSPYSSVPNSPRIAPPSRSATFPRNERSTDTGLTRTTPNSPHQSNKFPVRQTSLPLNPFMINEIIPSPPVDQIETAAQTLKVNMETLTSHSFNALSDPEITILKLLLSKITYAVKEKRRKDEIAETSKSILQKRGHVRDRISHLEKLTSAAKTLSSALIDPSMFKFYENTQIASLQKQITTLNAEARQEKEVQDRLGKLWEAQALTENLNKLRSQIEDKKDRLQKLGCSCDEFVSYVAAHMDEFKKGFHHLDADANWPTSAAEFSTHSSKFDELSSSVEDALQKWNNVLQQLTNMSKDMRKQVEKSANLSKFI